LRPKFLEAISEKTVTKYRVLRKEINKGERDGIPRFFSHKDNGQCSGIVLKKWFPGSSMVKRKED
jgi:hypothetical protein